MRRAHRQVRWSAPAIVVLVVAAVGADLAGSPWAALHLVLAGGVVSLISTVAVMLTVTWSAAPAPPDLLVGLQRAAIAGGVATAVAGHERGSPAWVPVAGAIAYAVGLVLLAVLLVVTARRGVQRRFDAAVAGYVVAIVAGLVGAALGATLVAGSVTVERRDAHRVVNLLGLIGIVAATTLPFFTATVGRSKMAASATARRLVLVVAWQAVAVAVAVAGVVWSSPVAGAVGLGAFALSLAVVLSLLPRPTRRQLRWAGPRLVALWLGVGWWTAATVAASAAVARGTSPFDAPWGAVLAVAGYGQIVWGSLAYLVPVVRGGGHEQLAAGFAITRSWTGLAAVNGAGIALVAGRPGFATAAVAVWAVDAVVRAVRVLAGGTRPRA